MIFFTEICLSENQSYGFIPAMQQCGELFVHTTLSQWHISPRLHSVHSHSMLTVLLTQRW